MSIRLKTVSFGTASTGLSTVGYTLYNLSGAVEVARQTTGVSELGIGTGIYFAVINFPDGKDVILLWDTGTGTPKYAPDEGSAQLNSIQEETDKIRIIWNTMKNTAEAYNKLSGKIDKIKTPDNKIDIDSLKSEIKKIVIPAIPTIEEIRKALTVVVKAQEIPAPVVNIPKLNIPDYTKQINGISEALNKISLLVNAIPKENQQQVIKALSESESRLKQLFSDNDLKINGVIGLAQKIQNTSDGITTKINQDATPAEISKLSARLSSLVDELKGKLEDTQTKLEATIIENAKLDKFVKEMVTFVNLNKMFDNNSESKKQTDLVRLGLGVK